MNSVPATPTMACIMLHETKKKERNKVFQGHAEGRDVSLT